MYNEKNYKIVKTREDISEALKYISSFDILAYDTETTGLNTRKDSIVGFSFSGKKGTGYYFPIRLYNKDTKTLEISPYYEEALDFIRQLSKKDLVMHNASFDTRFTLNDLGIDLLPSLVADTVLMKHTVEEEHPFGLKEIAASIWYKLGLPSKELATEEQQDLKESVLRNGGSWKKGEKTMYVADLDILGKYAAADTDLTLRIFDYYYTKLEQEGLLEFFFDTEVMPLLKEVTIPMEQNGILLDLQKITQCEKEISEDLEKLEVEIQKELSPYVGELESFLLEKEAKISNKGSFAQMICEEFGLVLPKTKAGKFSITLATLERLYITEENKDAINYLKCPDHVSISFRDKLYLLQKKYYLKKTNSKYILNIQSKNHLSKIFFDHLKEKPLSETDKGTPQMNDSFLEHLSKKYKSASLISDFNKLSKIKSTYIDRFLREQEDSCFYPQFKQFGTTSGRYGSDLQQLPRTEDSESGLSEIVLKYRNMVREFFIAKEGYKFIDCDYNSLEPVCFANDSADDALIEIFEKGYDMYSTVAIAVNKLENEYSADKNAENYLKKHKPHLRQSSKAYTLGIRYGLKEWKLSQDLGIEQEEAALIIQNYFEAFPNLKKSMDKYLWSAKKRGYVKSPLGRIRHLPEAKRIFTEYGNNILDPLQGRKVAKYTGLSIEEVRKIRKKFNGMLNNALNFPIQSTAASIVNRASIAINKEFKKKNICGKIVAQVHDQIIVEVVESQVEEAKVIVQDCMENTTKLEKIKLTAPPEVCSNFKEGH